MAHFLKKNMAMVKFVFNISSRSKILVKKPFCKLSIYDRRSFPFSFHHIYLCMKEITIESKNQL